MSLKPSRLHDALKRSAGTILGISVGAVIALAALVDVLGNLPSWLPTWPHYVAIGLVIVTASEGRYRRRIQKRSDVIEERLPDFLSHLATSRASGLNLTASVQAAAGGEYGELGSEIQRMGAQLALNASPADVLRAFGERANSRMVSRVVALLQDAIQSGGRTTAAFKAAAREAQVLRELREERESQLWVHVSIVHIAFAINVLVMLILTLFFVQPVFGDEGRVGDVEFTEFYSSAGLVVRFESLFIWGITISGLGSGLAIGATLYGKPLVGLPHSARLIALGYVAFLVATI
jgi:archaellum biogenesis protein FlaJ (TadC family)